MILDTSIRTGNKDVDTYIESLETEIRSFCASNSKKLIRSIDNLAGNISKKLDLISADEKNPDGTEIDLSNKDVDAYIKLLDKSDKIKNFSDLTFSMFGEGFIERTTTTETVIEKKTTGNKFEEIQSKIKGKQ